MKRLVAVQRERAPRNQGYRCMPTKDEKNAITVKSIPSSESMKNPYLRLLYHALKKTGIIYNGSVSAERSAIWEKNLGPDWLHLHWPEHIIHLMAPGWFKNLSRATPGFSRMAGTMETILPGFSVSRIKNREWENFLDRVSSSGTRIAWTVHNTIPHEQNGPLELSAYRALAERAHLKVFHGNAAALDFKSTYGSLGNHTIMAHGNYDTVYPEPHCPTAVRQSINISPKKPLFGLIGMLRANKGLRLIHEAANYFGDDIHFLCAGRVSTHISDYDFFRPGLLPTNIQLIKKALTDQELADYIACCDGVLFPYESATSSGALMAAITLSRGVVASNLPAFTEVIGKEGGSAGVVMHTHSTEGLVDAIQRYLAVPPEVRGAAARKIADEYTWDRVVRPFAKALTETDS